MTTVERFDDASATWIEITDYASFKIENGVSDILVAPTAQLQLPRTSTVSAGTRIRIREANTTFEGNVVRTKPRSQSAMRVDAEHDAYGLFDENISLSVSGTDEDVLQAALNAAGGSWTLAYSGTATSLGDTYEVEGRSVKRVFRDMTDRVGRVWWVDVDHTIHVEPLGYRGTFASVDTSQDAATVSEYTPDDVDTVVNDATVVGTGGEKVTGEDEDSASISEYGRQPERTNVSYITTKSEADAYASELLNPTPDSSATARLGASVGNVAVPLSNYTLDVTDEQGVGLNEELVIEKQVVTQRSAEVELGEGAGVNIAKFNRREKSKEDVTEPGSVYNSDRIADNAINSDKVTPGGIEELNLTDGAVSSIKLGDGSVLTTKIGDEQVTADKVTTGTITGAQFDRVVDGEVVGSENILNLLADKVIFAQTGDSADDVATEEGGLTVIQGGRIETRSIEADKIDTNTLTADEIDTLDLNTQELTIGTDATADRFIQFVLSEDDRLNARTTMIPGVTGACLIGTESDPFAEMNAQEATFVRIEPRDDGTGSVGSASRAYGSIFAYNYIDANDGSAINDGGSVLDGLADGHGPPDSAKVDGGGYSINDMARGVWDVVRAQQARINDLEDRLSALEAQGDPNA